MFEELQYACSEFFSILSLRSGSFKRTILDLRVRNQVEQADRSLGGRPFREA